MLLYAIYTPDVVNSWNREQVLAFASIERFVATFREISNNGKADKLEPITHEEARHITSVCRIVGHEDGDFLDVHSEGIRDTWDGSNRPVKLTASIADEQVFRNRAYA